ncbi:MAG: hypothetical protein WC494_02890 [Candidatus Pacearchaeota archaeon]
MKGVDLNLFLADIRVRLVLGLVVLAILIAIVLTYLEFKIRKRKEVVAVRSAEDKYIIEFLKTIDSLKSTEEKLSFLDKNVKRFLSENFGTGVHSDYSLLARQLKKQKEISSFCIEMFDAHYSSEITFGKVNDLSRTFIEIFKNIQAKKIRPQKKSLIDKLEPLFFESEKEKINKRELLDKILLFKGFLIEKLAKIMRVFTFKRKKSLNVDWSENFKDINKEILLKSAAFSGINNMELEKALISKQKEIAQKKLKESIPQKIKKRKGSKKRK